MPQVQAERVIARQASRFVAPQRLRAEVTHWPRAARPRVKKQQPFALAMPQAQAERVIARQASRFVAPRCWPVEVRRWPQAATHSAEQDSMGLAVPARLLPRPGRACQYSPDQDPDAFYPAMRADRKCNRAARCGDRPISDRCRKRRNRRGPVRYGNRNNHSRCRCAGHAQPFQISASDKCRCLLRRFADRDYQSANRGCKRAQARKRQGSPGFREREE